MLSRESKTRGEQVNPPRFEPSRFDPPLKETLRDTGGVLVEFALCVSVFLLMLFGVFFFSMGLYADQFVSYAANEAARYAMVRGSTWSGTTCADVSTMECMATSGDITRFVNNGIAPGLTTDNLGVTVSWPGTTPSGATCSTTNGDNNPGCSVTVSLTYAFNYPLPFWPHNAIVFHSASTVAISQ